MKWVDGKPVFSKSERRRLHRAQYKLTPGAKKVGELLLRIGLTQSGCSAEEILPLFEGEGLCQRERLD